MINDLKLNQDSENNANNKGIINAEAAVPWKYLDSFEGNPEMSLVNCEINIILTWSESCIISEGKRVATVSITNTKPFVPVWDYLNDRRFQGVSRLFVILFEGNTVRIVFKNDDSSRRWL